MALSQLLLSRFRTTDEVEACHSLVGSYFPCLSGTTGVVDVLRLAETAGIAIHHTEDAAFEGRFSWDSATGQAITLAPQSNSNRARFTAAHELGHWLLHQLQGADQSQTRYRGATAGDAAGQDEERLANLLAAEILMPLHALREAVAVRVLDLRLVRAVARRFQVNRLAALRRIADVVDTTMVYLNVVPNRFRSLSSFAVIDDVMYVLPRAGLFYDREKARLLRRIPFNEIASSREYRLGLSGSRGRVIADFGVARSSNPVPNADLLACGVAFRPDPLPQATVIS